MTPSESSTIDHLAGNHVWSTMEGGDRGPTLWRIVSGRYGKLLFGPRQIYRLRSLLHGPASHRCQDAIACASSSGPYLIVISSLYLLLFFELGSREILFLFLPLALILADHALRVLSRRFSERIISRKGVDVAWLTKRKKDFELSKKEIEELLMKSPLRGLNLGGSRGYLRITPKDHQVQPIEIKIHGWNQHQKLRDLVINFASREPRVRAVEYPYGQ